mgnify:CR=1 FL=1
MTQTPDIDHPGTKRAYAPPRLIRFGKIAELTVGGSLGATEWTYMLMKGCYVPMQGNQMTESVNPPNPAPSPLC